MKQSGTFCRAGVDAARDPAFIKITEGYASVLMAPPKGSAALAVEINNSPFGDSEQQGGAEPGAAGDDGQSVFYNKAQVVNRDLSVCMLQAFADIRRTEAPRKGGTRDLGITVLEALSATGLRAIRYWHEVRGLRKIIANDMDPDAVACIARNLEYNNVPCATVEASSQDAESIVESLAAFKAKRKQGEGQGDAAQAALREEMDAIRHRHTDAVAGVVPSLGDAVTVMQRLAADPFSTERLVALDKATGAPRALLQQEKMDVVDLDPYGTAAPFLDSAVQCAKEGALMLVTCTDSAILCGSYSETCHAKYGSLSLRADYCHEFAARLVLGLIERTANRHGRFVQPLLTLHIDFYVRVFVRIYTQPAEAKRAVSKMAHVLQCNRCPAFRVMPVGNARPPRAQREQDRKREREPAAGDDQAPPKPPVAFAAPPPKNASMHVTPPTLPEGGSECCVCGGRVGIAGPIYGGVAHDPEFLGKVRGIIDERAADGHLTAHARVRGLVSAAMDELPDTPLFYRIDHCASLLKMRVPRAPLIVGALRRLGYRCSQVHCEGTGLKTDCPVDVLIGVFRAYREANPDKDDGVVPESVRVAAVPNCDFTYSKEFDYSSGATGVVKFVHNAPGWGPLARHRGAAEDAA